MRLPQPTFSWSLIGHVEATYQDEAEKNRICTPIAPPDAAKGLAAHDGAELSNQLVWSKTPGIREWQVKSRLDPFTRRIRSIKRTEGSRGAPAALLKYVGPGGAKRGAYA